MSSSRSSAAAAKEEQGVSGDHFDWKRVELEYPVEPADAEALGVSVLEANLMSVAEELTSDGVPVIENSGNWGSCKPGVEQILRWPTSAHRSDGCSTTQYAWSSVEGARPCFLVSSERGAELEEEDCVVVNFWRDDGKPSVPEALTRKLDYSYVVEEWKNRGVVFVDYPRPESRAADEVDAFTLTERMRELTWAMCLVPDVFHVESAGNYKPKSGPSRFLPRRVTMYGRCSCCGRLVSATVPFEECKRVEDIDWPRVLTFNEGNDDVVNDSGVGSFHGGHFAKPEHLDRWLRYGGALSSVLGLLGPGLASRHGGFYPNRVPAHLIVSGKDWVPSVGVEAAMLPTKDMVEVVIGHAELLGVAVLQLLWRGHCRCRDPDDPKVWFEIKPEQVYRVHLGLVYWSPSITKSGGKEYADPRVRYMRLKSSFESVDEYYSSVVGAEPGVEWGLYPEKCATVELEERAKASGRSDGQQEVLMRPKDRILNMFPSGKELSWWLVAELEPKAGTALQRRVRDAFPVICKQQVVER